jgi:hypothetical protein
MHQRPVHHGAAQVPAVACKFKFEYRSNAKVTCSGEFARSITALLKFQLLPAELYAKNNKYNTCSHLRPVFAADATMI